MSLVHIVLGTLAVLLVSSGALAEVSEAPSASCALSVVIATRFDAFAEEGKISKQTNAAFPHTIRRVGDVLLMEPI